MQTDAEKAQQKMAAELAPFTALLPQLLNDPVVRHGYETMLNHQGIAAKPLDAQSQQLLGKQSTKLVQKTLDSVHKINTEHDFFQVVAARMKAHECRGFDAVNVQQVATYLENQLAPTYGQAPVYPVTRELQMPVDGLGLHPTAFVGPDKPNPCIVPKRQR